MAAIDAVPYQPLPGEPSAPFAEAEEEGSSLQPIIEKAEALSNTILLANQRCHELGESHKFYANMSGGWETFEDNSLAVLKELKALEGNRLSLMAQRNEIIRDFCAYDSSHHVTKDSNPLAKKFKELIDTMNTSLSAYSENVPELRERYLDTVKHLGIPTRKETEEKEAYRRHEQDVRLEREIQRAAREIKLSFKESQKKCCCFLS